MCGNERCPHSSAAFRVDLSTERRETTLGLVFIGVSLGGSGEASVTGGMAGLAESGWAVSAESPSKVGQDRSSADSRRSTRFSIQNQDLSSAVTFADGVRPLAVGSAELKGGLRWAHKPTGDARCHLILCLRAGRADVKKRTLEWTAAQAGLHRRMTFKAAHTHEHQLIPMSIDLQ